VERVQTAGCRGFIVLRLCAASNTQLHSGYDELSARPVSTGGRRLSGNGHDCDDSSLRDSAKSCKIAMLGGRQGAKTNNTGGRFDFASS